MITQCLNSPRYRTVRNQSVQDFYQKKNALALPPSTTSPVKHENKIIPLPYHSPSLCQNNKNHVENEYLQMQC